MLHAGGLLALLAFALLAFMLLLSGSSLGFAVVALLVGGLGAGLTILVVLALMLLLSNCLRHLIAGGNALTRGILGQGLHLDAVGFLNDRCSGSLSH